MKFFKFIVAAVIVFATASAFAPKINEGWYGVTSGGGHPFLGSKPPAFDCDGPALQECAYEENEQGTVIATLLGGYYVGPIN